MHVLKELGGWSSTEMLDKIYGHCSQDDQRAALERLSGTAGDLPK